MGCCNPDRMAFHSEGSVKLALPHGASAIATVAMGVLV